MNSNIYLDSKSWPFQEALKILERVKKQKHKDFVLFETGYGPSGLPHIGTFGEVLRTSMVRHAFEKISDIPTKMYVISDDLDGMRKIPDNVPNKDLLEKYIGFPLTKVPDPFGKFDSYADYMNDKLKSFLDHFGFDYEFKSATKLYKEGVYNEKLIVALQNHQDILDVMLPTLGDERKKTYSPFMPISPNSGKVLEVKIEKYNIEDNTISYYEDGEYITSSILDGNCKLQWKPDMGMRWSALDVDYEMYGKDHLASAELYSSICKILGGKIPEQMHYELFLDHEGKKISKSKGNGITIDDWLKYANQESLSLYMFTAPKKAKRLYFDVIPKQVENYQIFLKKFYQEEENKKIDNPVYHIHNGNPPKLDQADINFSLLINLASACNPDNSDILWGFVKKYSSDITAENSPLIKELCEFALRYYNDFIVPNKKFITPNENQKNALITLKNDLMKLDNNTEIDELQNLVYKIGRDYFGKENMKDWFGTIYQVLLGNKEGPRFASFIKLYGINKIIELIENKCESK